MSQPRVAGSSAEEWCAGAVALVTGASSGIGLAVATALGERGARVGVNYFRNAEGAETARRQIEAAGGEALLLRADVSRQEEVERMFDAVAEGFGAPPRMLVNNAGAWMEKTAVADCSESEWDRVFAVNAKSVFLCCRAAARRMVGRVEGAIVNVGSVAGHTGGAGGTVPYAAAKAAVHTLTRGLARELGPHGIRVNAVAPGVIDTRMIEESREAFERLARTTPLGRCGAPSEVAAVVLMLLSPAASYISGEIVEVNGGLLMR